MQQPHNQHGTNMPFQPYNMVPPYQVITNKNNMAPIAISTPTRTITPWPGCLKTNLGHQPLPGCISPQQANTLAGLLQTATNTTYCQRVTGVMQIQYANTSTMARMPNKMFNDKALRQNNAHIITNITKTS